VVVSRTLEVHPIDGTYELFRHYYALPYARDSEWPRGRRGAGRGCLTGLSVREGAVTRRRGRIEIHRVENFGVARARNFGAGQARGDAIVYADAHLRLEPDWWRPMVDLLENPKVGGVAPGITGYRLAINQAAPATD
jgi:glycosyltransferase involved in cell wall biosynthesis